MRNTRRRTWRFGAVVGVTALAAGSLAAVATQTSLLAAPGSAAKPTSGEAVRDAERAITHDQAAITAIKADKNDAYQPGAVIIDGNGARHVRFARTYHGLAVLGGDSIVHSNPDGSFNSATSNLSMPVTVGTKPSVTEAAARSIAEKTFTGTRNKTTATLVVDAVGGRPTLAWRVVVDGIAESQAPSHLNVIVDAATGRVRRTYDQFHTAEGTGHGLQVGEVKIGTTLTGGAYQLLDPDRGNGETRDALNKGNGNANPTRANSATFTDADNVWGNGQLTDRATVGVDAQFGVQSTWDYYKSVHGRNGIWNDGKGAVSYVHYGKNYANAGYDDVDKIMIYGDGAPGSKPFTAIDVAGHEMSHGVTAATANLNYDGESGGLNEATSDIFGTLVEFHANAAADKPDYLIGENIDIFGNGKPLRYMDDPKKDGKSASCWTPTVGNLDVHYSSGVGNHFFYNLAVGTGKSEWGDSPICGTAAAMKGIGNEGAGKIWYRALTTYMVSTTDYAGARIASLKAAKDLYGAHSTEYDAVNAAWAAVAVVGEDPFPVPSTQAPVVTAPSDQTATVGTPVSLQVTATDPQNDVLTFSATGLPVGLAIDAKGLITGTPTIAGSAVVTVTAKDPAGNAGTASFTWTVKPADTPPTGCGTPQLVTDGGFEHAAPEWVQQPAGIIRAADGSTPAHAGSQLALFGGTGAAGTQTLTQKVTIPADCTKAKLTFYLHVDTTETAPAAKDKFTVSVGGKQFGFWSNKNAADGYTLRTFNVAEFAGKTVDVVFTGVENKGNATTFTLDDVALTVAGKPAPPAEARTPGAAAYTVKLKSDDTGAVWTGTQKVGFSNTSPTPLTEVYLRLWDNFHGTCPADQPIKVTNVVGGTAGDLTVDCTALKITLPAPLAKGQRAAVSFDLSISVPDGADRFGRNGAYSYLGNALPVLAVRDAAGWHLDPYTNNGESFYTLASDFTVKLDHPTALKVPATGVSTDIAGTAGRTVTTATAKKVRDFAWASGPFSSSSGVTPSGVAVNTYWTTGVTDATAANLQAVSISALEAHAGRFGAFPYGEQDVVIDNAFWFGGMEYPGFVLDMPSSTAAAHELAHQWFFGIVGDNEYADPWLDESFADYATDLYFNQTRTGCSITWQSADEKLSNSMAYWDAHSSRYGSVVYSYGKCTLHDLRRVLGDAPMAQLLKDYAKAHWYGVSTTADFKAAAQEVASGLAKPVDLTSFWASHRVEG